MDGAARNARVRPPVRFASNIISILSYAYINDQTCLSSRSFTCNVVTLQPFGCVLPVRSSVISEP